MAERPSLWPGHRVLELGCGLGLPAMAAAKLGARVIASDFHPDNGAFLIRNAARNRAQVDVLTMDWGRPPFEAVVGHAKSLGFSAEIHTEEEGSVVEFTR